MPVTVTDSGGAEHRHASADLPVAEPDGRLLVVVGESGRTVAVYPAHGWRSAVASTLAEEEPADAEVGEESEGEVEFAGGRSSSVLDAPPLRVADVRDDGDRFAEELLDDLRRLGDTYGPLGVALAASTLTDPQALVRAVVDEHGGAEVLQGVRPPEEDATLVTYRREVDEQTARAEREHAARLGLERRLAEVRAHLASVLAERDADAVELYVPVAARVTWDGRKLRALYLRPHEGEVGSEAYTDGKGRPLTIDDVRDEHASSATSIGDVHLHVARETIRPPIEEDPRRPHPDSWPDDAVLLRYVELRRLVALHLERYGDARAARAMLEGDVPLRVSEVLG